MMLYNDGAISVDLNFARFGSKSYAINKINTVEVRERQPHGLGMAIFFGVLAALTLIGAIQNLNATALVFGIGFVALTVWAWKRHKIREYDLFLMTSSSSTQAYMTRNRDEVLSLRDAVETAMTRQHERTVHVQHGFVPQDDDAVDQMKPVRGGTIRQKLIG
jgi:hypothetical protein